MTLNPASLDWAIDFVAAHSDGDLFPRLPEIEAVTARKSEFIADITSKPLSELKPSACRRFLVPKDEISYRQATQLDPQDSIVFSAIVHQFGAGVEARRLPAEQVFSYRFNPASGDGLYGQPAAWNDFWRKAVLMSRGCTHILYCDIADFYNQISHHTVENQLIAANWPNQAIGWVMSLLKSTTAGVSRGVPVGPHPSHLIAEASLIPVDNSLQQTGLTFIRYADDLIFFCGSEEDRRTALATTATILDKQQRLMLQRHKTRKLDPESFRKLCAKMIEDRPINENESDLLAIVRKYSGGNPYKTITYNQISPEDWQHISENSIRDIIAAYLEQQDVDYIRLRWFYRRLSQIGHPGAINASLENLDRLGPCFANVVFYLSSVHSVDESTWKEIGKRLLALLDRRDVKQNEYFRLSVLSLFGRNPAINHFSSLACLYQASDPFVRREVLLAAHANQAFDWIRLHKESFGSMDPWQKFAYLFCISGLPSDEKEYFIKSFKFQRPFEQALAKWSNEA
jgi:retron-type reverse transcriptase